VAGYALWLGCLAVLSLSLGTVWRSLRACGLAVEWNERRNKAMNWRFFQYVGFHPKWFTTSAGAGLALGFGRCHIISARVRYCLGPGGLPHRNYQAKAQLRIMLIHVPGPFLANPAYIMLAVPRVVVGLVWRLKLGGRCRLQCAAPITALDMTFMPWSPAPFGVKPNPWGTYLGVGCVTLLDFAAFPCISVSSRWRRRSAIRETAAQG